MDLQLFAGGAPAGDNLTKMQDMIDPEVMADMISAKLEDAIRFSPIASIDTALEGRPGTTLTVPKFKYIGDAKDVAEGEPIEMAKLTTDSETFTIKKAGIGVEITDEAILSGLGDPVGEAEKQMLMSIANKIDNDSLEALGTTPLEFSGTKWDADTISDAQDIFNDEEDETMVLFLHPKDPSKLRKAVAGEWERPTDLGDQILITGTYGGVLGAQVVRSRKLKEGEGFLVKPGALKIFMKRRVMVEDDRDIIKKITFFTADQHYGVYLYDESKAIKIKVEETGGGVEG